MCCLVVAAALARVFVFESPQLAGLIWPAEAISRMVVMTLVVTIFDAVYKPQTN
jgi:hypothetical protein